MNQAQSLKVTLALPKVDNSNDIYKGESNLMQGLGSEVSA